MRRQKQTNRVSPCCLVSLHTVRICKQLQKLVPVCLVFHHVVSESLRSCFIEPLKLSVCLQIVRCTKKVFGNQFSAYRVEGVYTELLFFFG